MVFIEFLPHLKSLSVHLNYNDIFEVDLKNNIRVSIDNNFYTINLNEIKVNFQKYKKNENLITFEAERRKTHLMDDFIRKPFFDVLMVTKVECNCGINLVINKELSCRHLPSENWKEFMDCWVCHPTSKDKQFSYIPTNISIDGSKVYFGNNYLLLHEDNFISENVIIIKKELLHCRSCKEFLGKNQKEIKAFKLNSYSVRLNNSLSNVSFKDFFISDIYENYNSFANFKFLITGDNKNGREKSLLLWVLKWECEVFLDPSLHKQHEYVFNKDKGEDGAMMKVVKFQYLISDDPEFDSIQRTFGAENILYYRNIEDICDLLVTSTLFLPVKKLLKFNVGFLPLK
jgi:hypothetical protein